MRRYFLAVATDGEIQAHLIVTTQGWRPAPNKALDYGLAGLAARLGVEESRLAVTAFHRI